MNPAKKLMLPMTNAPTRMLDTGLLCEIISLAHTYHPAAKAHSTETILAIIQRFSPKSTSENGTQKTK